ncbi:hypothetical protein [Ralstonia phage RP13]|nr:hypothetical protein [Ralstonia phage RP13]
MTKTSNALSSFADQVVADKKKTRVTTEKKPRRAANPDAVKTPRSKKIATEAAPATVPETVTTDFNRWCYKGQFPAWMVSVATKIAAEFDCTIEVVKKTNEGTTYVNYHYVMITGAADKVKDAQVKYQAALDSMIAESDVYWMKNRDQLKEHGVTPQKAKNAFLLEQATTAW